MRILLFILLLIYTTICNGQKYFGRVITQSIPDPLADVNIIADGNSYYANIFGYTPSPNVLLTLSPFATNGATLHNFGVSAQQTSDMLADVNSQIIPLYNSAVLTNVILFQEGGNDLYYNGRVDSAIARTTRYCNIVKAAGFKIIVSTLIHRNQSTAFGDNASQYNTKIDNYNTELVALNGTGVFDGIIRPDLEAIFSTYSSGYHSDEVHPNQVGQNKYADLYKAAILNL